MNPNKDSKRPCSHMDAYLPSHKRYCAERNYGQTPKPDETKASPLPWRESPASKVSPVDGIHSADGCNVANLNSSVAPNAANMSLIVRRVNEGPQVDAALDALTKALERLMNGNREYMKREHPEARRLMEYTDAFVQAKAALQLAREVRGGEGR